MSSSTATARVHVTFSQAMAILRPYSWHHVKEQIVIVVPVCLYMALFQITVLKHGLGHVASVVSGIGVLILGLAFFLEGVRIGLVPLGDAIGNTLPRRSSLPVVLVFAFVLGNLAAFGEPVIGSLQIAGAGVDPAKAPLLYRLLVAQPMLLVAVISLSVGVAVVLGTLRFIHGWSLKWLVLPLVGVAIGLTVIASRNHTCSRPSGWPGTRVP